VVSFENGIDEEMKKIEINNEIKQNWETCLWFWYFSRHSP
jgi:hypothetical protein